MIRPVIGTIATRVLVMLANLAVIMVAGHRMGAAGLGDISLVVLAITFILLVSNVIGGSAITYLLPRHSLRALLVPSYVWTVITAVLAYIILEHTGLTPGGTELHVVLLACLSSIFTIHFNALLGRQRILWINALQLMQAIVMLTAFLVLVIPSPSPEVFHYITALYWAYGITALGSIIAILLLREQPRTDHLALPVIRQMVRQGGFVQAANMLQLLNYRLAYYLLEKFQGLAALGIYSVGVQVSESAWLGPKSLGSVLYARVSNTDDAQANARLSITAAKVAMLMAAAVLTVLVLIPDEVYQWSFGPDFLEITDLVLLLSPGIIAMAVSQALSHYYSGTGRNIHNMVGSGIGVLATLVFGFWLVPGWGIAGAAITASIAYGVNVLYQFIVFVRVTQLPFSSIWFGTGDLALLMRLVRRTLPRS